MLQMYNIYSQDGEGDELKAKKRFRASLSPTPDVECVPRLDHEFRRPPPPHQHKRRKPSRGHLQSLATGSGITTTTPMEIGPVSSGMRSTPHLERYVCVGFISAASMS